MHEFIIPKLSLETISSYAQSENIYLRGTQYYDEGAVSECIKLNHMLQSHVAGSQVQPYRVCIYYNEDGIINSRCTCEYDGYVCKHVIATLLECLNKPQSVIIIESVFNSLAALNEEQLRRLLESLINQSPELHHQLSIEIAELKSTASKMHAKDTEPYKHAVRSAFKKAKWIFSGFYLERKRNS